ncbi:MAG: hypothetical protein IJQ12_00120 [Lachnospiraceae bacterium]|nr:hypothetical protein [Lachnospiraceae bacterium]
MDVRRILIPISIIMLLIGCSAKQDTSEKIERIAAESGYMVEEGDGGYSLLKDNTEIAIENRGNRVSLQSVKVEVISKKKSDNQENTGTLQIVPVNNSEIEVYLDYESPLNSGRTFPGKIFITCDYEFDYIQNHSRDALAKFEKYYYNITNNWATKEELQSIYHGAREVVDEINDGLNDN